MLARLDPELVAVAEKGRCLAGMELRRMAFPGSRFQNILLGQDLPAIERTIVRKQPAEPAEVAQRGIEKG